MKTALVYLDGGANAARLRAEIVRILCERGDDVTLVCGANEEPPDTRARVARIKPFALGTAWLRKAFAKAADDHVRSGGYDLVLGYGDGSLHDAVRLSAGCAQTRVDLAHAQRPTKDDEARLEIEERALSKGAFKVAIAPSSLVKKDVVRRHAVAPESVSVVSEGVDLVRFHPGRRASDGATLRAGLRLAPDDFVVLLHGPELDKAELERLLRVVPELARERPSLRIVVTEADGALEKLASPLGERVRFVYETASSDLLPAADLFLMHTLYAPFAGETLQALASGVPVITSAYDGACEIVEEDRSGSVLIGFGDSQSVYRMLAHWTKLERARAGAQLARRAAEAHGVAAKAAELVGILDGVAAQKTGT